MITVNVYSARAVSSKGVLTAVRHRFETRREAIAFVKSLNVSFVRRLAQSYTVYARQMGLPLVTFHDEWGRPFQAVAPAFNRARIAAEVDRRRRDDALCASDFLTWGDTRGVHAEFCVSDETHSRDYNPGPAPADEAMYEGTPLGVLWGLAGTDRYAWQLAGWNLTTQDFKPPALPPTEGRTK